MTTLHDVRGDGAMFGDPVLVISSEVSSVDDPVVLDEVVVAVVFDSVVADIGATVGFTVGSRVGFFLKVGRKDGG
jgi:hypothetical protein